MRTILCIIHYPRCDINISYAFSLGCDCGSVTSTLGNESGVQISMIFAIVSEISMVLLQLFLNFWVNRILWVFILIPYFWQQQLHNNCTFHGVPWNENFEHEIFDPLSVETCHIDSNRPCKKFKRVTALYSSTYMCQVLAYIVGGEMRQWAVECCNTMIIIARKISRTCNPNAILGPTFCFVYWY